MKRIDRIRQQLDEARSNYMHALRRGAPCDAVVLKSKVTVLEARLAEAEEYETRRLRDMLPREVLRRDKVAESIAAIHLVMDCLIEVTMDFRKKLDRHGLVSTELCGKVKQLESYANAILNDACRLGHDGLTKFIVEDDELVDSMCELVYNYIDKTLDKDDKD